MIHVVHVLHELMPSGAETMLAVAGPWWAGHGVRCTVLATAPTPGPYAAQLAAAGYAVHHLPMARDVASFIALRKWLKKQQVDCMHLHKETNADYYVLAACGAVKQIVCTHHSVFQFAGRVRWRRVLARKLGALLGARYVSIGESVRDNERQRFFNRTQMIHNWFDSSRFRVYTDAQRQAARQQLGVPQGTLAVLTVGNCAAVKNHGALIQALAHVSAKQVIYLHAGREDADHSERALATQLRIADRVRFLGPRSDIPDLLAACDGYVMPSLHEGLPISALEALVSGVPCLLSDVPGLRDFRAYAPLIQWSAPTPEALTAALAEWLPKLTPGHRAGCAAQAAQVAAAFSLGDGVARYAAAYKGLPAPMPGLEHRASAHP